MDLETVSHFATQNHRKSPKCVQSGSQEAPQIHLKIDKTGPLGLSVSIGCPPGPQDHQNGVPGTQNGASRSPKRHLWVSKVTHSSRYQVQGTRYQVPGTRSCRVREREWTPPPTYQTDTQLLNNGLRYQIHGTRYLVPGRWYGTRYQVSGTR